MVESIFENDYVRIEVEAFEIPWLKLFAKQHAKEFTDCSVEGRQEIFRLLVLIEQEMLRYFQPEKINIASFGNYLPSVHWHIMARFKTDSYFPEPVWGNKQRQAILDYPSMSVFINQLRDVLGTSSSTD